MNLVAKDVTAPAEAPPESAARRASGSSFYAAMRMLPRPQRVAIFEIYGFCRAVDDVADDGGPRETRLVALEEWRRDVDALYAGSPPARLAKLDNPVRQFGLARQDFLAIIEGMEMDVRSDIRGPDLATLDHYCDCVASAVGRLCVKVFGLAGPDGIDLAHHLGRALQLINILRDLDEDAALGRLYLPREALIEAGIVGSDPAMVLSNPALGRACARVTAIIREHLNRADTIMRRCPRSTVRAPRIMGEAYKVYLDKLTARGFSPPREPVRIGRSRLLLLVLRCLAL